MPGHFAAAPLMHVLEMPSKDTEYSYTLPDGCTYFSLQARQNVDVRISTEEGKVVGKTNPYWTFKKNWAASSAASLWGSATITLYFAHSSDSQVDIEFWMWR